MEKVLHRENANTKDLKLLCSSLGEMWAALDSGANQKLVLDLKAAPARTLGTGMGRGGCPGARADMLKGTTIAEPG